MREILFKAKRVDNGEWVEGSLVIRGEQYLIFTGETKMFGYMVNWIWYEVDINTICQYTGLTDKNGNMIWENDIIHIGDENIRHIIEWYDNGFMGKAIGAHNRIGLTYWQSKIENIGNIFDNADLLEGE